MPVTIDPSTEAAQALTAVINAGSAYVLPVAATYDEIEIDTLELVQSLRVDVATEDSKTLEEVLEIEDYSSIDLRIWIRQQCSATDQASIDALKLLTRQIWQQVNGYYVAGHAGGSLDINDRVKLMDCDIDQKQNGDKDLLQKNGLFVASIKCRVEVAPSP